MTNLTSRIGLAALGALFAACVAPGGGDGGPTGGPVPLDQLGPAYVDGLCSVLTRCYASTFPYCDLDHCRADQSPVGLQALLLEIDAGWTRYDPAAAGNCKARYESGACSEFFFFFVPNVAGALSVCPGVLTGQRAEGESCVSAADCAPGTICVPRNQCPGTCVAYAQLGEPCDFSTHYCDASKKLSCRNGTCRGPWKAGDACATLADCSPDFWCQLDAGACMPLAGPGQTCSRLGVYGAADCTAGNWCDERFTLGTCRARSSQGGPCLDDSSCASGLACIPDGGALGVVCAPPGGLGSPCDSLFDCASGLTCGPASTCQARPGLGEACTGGLFSTPCQSGLTCNGSVCAQLRCPGQTCDAQNVCTSALCDAGTCTTRRPLGASCAAASECASNACTGGTCADPVACTP